MLNRGGYGFYHIGRDFYPNLADLILQIQSGYNAVLLINYFGCLNLKETISTLKKIPGDFAVIVDNVQSFYGSEFDADYSFNSYRKWFPVPDGAVAKSKNGWKSNIKQYGSNKFAEYKFAGNLLKSYAPYVSDEFYLGLLEQGEKKLDSDYNCQPSEIGMQLMSQIDVKEAAEKRKRNAAYLHDELTKLGIVHLYAENIVPMFVPIIVPKDKRTYIRKNMFQDSIFCPIHWPYEGAELSGNNVLYSEELSLICDQRYDERDLKRIIEVLKTSFE